MKKFISFFVSICLLTLGLTFNSTDVQAASYDKAYAAVALVVKSSPGTSYKTLGKIKAGQTVYVYGGVPIGKDQGNLPSYKQYGWSKIKYKNKYAYVKTHQLSFANPYNWAPGIKTRVINEIKKEYVSKKDKTKLVKSNVTSNQGFYTMYIQFDGKGKWYQLVTINCKTGWYHG
ncbi:cell division site-positioning protein MapZ family protein [Bacillus massilinigeriensis]|uniref:cell division site-positioning protein MapZ family protein n=1 Tax=Bacillus massilionigeriensis TaxID=1805475 RepID=UPI00096AE0DD|nr:cell division site-positioning protein MapZ family protein [Bacillus massilionigeriensis]